MRFDVKEVIDKYGVEAAIALDEILSNPKPLTKKYVWETLDLMFPYDNSSVLKELYGCTNWLIEENTLESLDRLLISSKHDV